MQYRFTEVDSIFPMRVLFQTQIAFAMTKYAPKYFKTFANHLGEQVMKIGTRRLHPVELSSFVNFQQFSNELEVTT
jgi:hypothetical protein